ncbi:hypothetical protein BJV77DRAFT_1148304 [Russula vinacea]|nr:hypothetical protein BJV77DRAFT_1148304 [Russula vinacea]
MARHACDAILVFYSHPTTGQAHRNLQDPPSRQYFTRRYETQAPEHRQESEAVKTPSEQTSRVLQVRSDTLTTEQKLTGKPFKAVQFAHWLWLCFYLLSYENASASTSMPHDENPRAHNAAEEGRVANLWDLKALMLSRGVCIQEQVMNSKTISRPSVLRALSGGDPLTGRAEQTSNPGQRGGQKEPHGPSPKVDWAVSKGWLVVYQEIQVVRHWHSCQGKDAQEWTAFYETREEMGAFLYEFF